VALAWYPLWLGALAVGACTESTSFEGETPLPTSMSVAPVDFRGNVPCAAPDMDIAGAMRSFQVTLVDVTDAAAPFALPSSSVIPCLQSVEFTYVVPDHSYIALVSAFDRDDLTVPAPGYPQAVDADGAEVTPTWTTTCYGTQDALDAATEGMGGAGGVGGAGGAGGAANEAGAGGAGGALQLGAVAVLNAQIAVRGCVQLQK
jgi:hypothetical protein